MLEPRDTSMFHSTSTQSSYLSDFINLQLDQTQNLQTNTKESYEDYFDPRFPRFLSVLLFIIGIFGNLLSILVFTQRQMKKNSTFIYLACLCFIDLFVICLGLGDIILISYFKIILRNKALIICRIHTFFTYSFTHLSSFILASVSIDRAIATNSLNFAKYYCTSKTANRVIIVNFLMAFVINFHSLFFLGYEEKHYFYSNSTNHSYYCASLDGTVYDHFIDPYFQWIDLIFYAILPFITMAICSFLILRVIFMSNKRVAKQLSINSSALIYKHSSMREVDLDDRDHKERDRETYFEGLNKQRNSAFGLSKFFVKKSTIGDKKTNYRLNKTIHLTYTLISINALFFCLVSPLAIVMIMIKGKTSVLENKVLINIVYLLAYSNHSFNFIFYGLSSPPYRECVFSLLGFNKNKNSLHLIGASSRMKRNATDLNRNEF